MTKEAEAFIFTYGPLIGPTIGAIIGAIGSFFVAYLIMIVQQNHFQAKVAILVDKKKSNKKNEIYQILCAILYPEGRNLLSGDSPMTNLLVNIENNILNKMLKHEQDIDSDTIEMLSTLKVLIDKYKPIASDYHASSKQKPDFESAYIKWLDEALSHCENKWKNQYKKHDLLPDEIELKG